MPLTPLRCSCNYLPTTRLGMANSRRIPTNFSSRSMISFTPEIVSNEEGLSQHACSQADSERCGIVGLAGGGRCVGPQRHHSTTLFLRPRKFPGARLLTRR